MAEKTLRYISTKMKDLDLCMMNTIGARGAINSRPMSNNRDVRYDGNSYFFSNMDTHKVKDLQNNPTVSLTFNGKKGLFIQVSGKAKLVKSRAVMEEHWVDSLDQW